ncbi:MAG TPA: zinc ribbon domain-containing protein [Spirochaetia bacterium]|nr:zinc ribbon domain-containing protein [Spirochaetia bacterium]
MPIYELKCDKCGHQFTMLGSYAEKEKTNCPQCGSPDLRQVYFGVSSPKGKSSSSSCSSGGGFRGG